MKKITSFIVLVLISHIGFAQNAKIDFHQTENTIDYGKVTKQSDNGIREFTFTNTGNSPLNIIGVQSTPGCSITYSPSQPILPGKSDRIEVKYNMTVGPIRKTITVDTNATNYDEGRVPLKIKGEVIN